MSARSTGTAPAAYRAREIARRLGIAPSTVPAALENVSRRNLAHLPHRNPLRWHSVPPSDKPKERPLRASRRGLHPNHAAGGIIPEWVGGFARNPHSDPAGLLCAAVPGRVLLGSGAWIWGAATPTIG